MTFTKFFDMCSGGREKTEHGTIVIQGNVDEAVAKFEEVFGRDPYNTTCDCCGPDYSIDEYETLEEALHYYPAAFVITEETHV